MSGGPQPPANEMIAIIDDDDDRNKWSNRDSEPFFFYILAFLSILSCLLFPVSLYCRLVDLLHFYRSIRSQSIDPIVMSTTNFGVP